MCKYNGQYYCFDCHIDDERVIPARVLFNWDFRRHRVCRASCEFLDSIAESAVLNIEETNPALYMYIPELEEALVRIKKFSPILNFLLHREIFEGGFFTVCKYSDLLPNLWQQIFGSLSRDYGSNLNFWLCVM